VSTRIFCAVISCAGNEPAINARNRIGPGPWYNAKGVRVAENVADLHGDKNNLGKQTSLTEKGEVVNGRGDNPNRHDILTGSQLQLFDSLTSRTLRCVSSPDRMRLV